MTVKLCSSEAMVERESLDIIPKLSRLRPFDVSVMFDHMLDKAAWRLELKMLRVDTTIVLPATEITSSSKTQTACPKENSFVSERM